MLSQEHILEYLRTKLNEIIKDTTAEMYANSLRVAMNKQGITSMKTAAKTIGKNTRTARPRHHKQRQRPARAAAAAGVVQGR